MGESQCKDFFQPLVASTPVKEPATCIDLDDSDSDDDCIETPPKRRPLFPNEPRCVNLDDTISSKPSLSSFCSADTPVKTDARREPVWINHFDSSTNETADEPFSVQGSETFKLSCRNLNVSLSVKSKTSGRYKKKYIYYLHTCFDSIHINCL